MTGPTHVATTRSRKAATISSCRPTSRPASISATTAGADVNVTASIERDIPEKIVRRAITFAPGKDVPIVVTDAIQRAQPADDAAREPVAV